MGIPTKWLYTQLRAGRILLVSQPSGAYLFTGTPEVIAAVRGLRDTKPITPTLGHINLTQRGITMDDRGGRPS